jgi:ATP-dependent helicase/nuclease subunit A
MTIHRSKGLGFDYVVLPLYERSALAAESSEPLIGDGWILPDPGPRVARAVGGLEAAYRMRRDRVEQEALSTYYVAMTRAKSSMTIVLHPAGSSLRFSDMVRSADVGGLGEGPVVGSAADGGDRDGGAPQPVVRAARTGLKRRLPSLAFRTGQSAGEFFVPKSRRRQAIEKGVEAHARYERIEWLDPSEAETGLDRALVRPADGATLWRERSFEVFAGGVWTSGRFDRVVFSGEGESRRAVIYDFKTNRRRPDESAGDFAFRMESGYRAQMAAYRAALSHLTGIRLESVDAVLLLVDTGEACKVRADIV